MFFISLYKSKKSTLFFVDNVDNSVYNSCFPLFSTIFCVDNFEDKMWGTFHPRHFLYIFYNREYSENKRLYGLRFRMIHTAFVFCAENQIALIPPT